MTSPCCSVQSSLDFLTEALGDPQLVEAKAVHGNQLEKSVLAALIGVVSAAGALDAVSIVSGVAWAQSHIAPVLPRGSDADDLDEVEDIAPETKYEQGNHTEDFQDSSTVRQQQDEELGFSDAEVRSGYDYALTLALGTAKPWTVFSIDAMALVRENFAVGLYAGGGSFNSSGIVDDRSFDLRFNSRSAGLSGRYFFANFESFSLEAVLAYAAWEGRVSPHGSDEVQEIDAADKLTASFRAHGPVLGVAAAFTWLWEGGFYLEWVPLGMQRSRIQQRDSSRQSASVDEVLERTLEVSTFYGLTNIRVGTYF